MSLFLAGFVWVGSACRLAPVKQVTNDGGKVTAELVAGDTANSGDVPGESAVVIAIAFLRIPPNRLIRPDIGQIIDGVVGRRTRLRNEHRRNVNGDVVTVGLVAGHASPDSPAARELISSTAARMSAVR